MAVDVIVGLQRGDEGKGRFVDMLAEEHDIVARFNGGNNAGHTVVLPDGRELALHLVPSGIAHEHTMNVIGNGTLVNPSRLVKEIADIESKGLEVSQRKLKISSAAHMILPHHVYADKIREASTEAQGSTETGVAPSAGDKAMRIGVRMERIGRNPDALRELVLAGLRAQRPLREAAGIEAIDEEDVAKAYVDSAIKVGPFVTDTVVYLNQELRKDNPAMVLAEGAQAYWLDIDHGMYPYTTSTNTTAGGVCTGLGVAPQFIDKVYGIAKAVQSHVGGGPFVTEITDPDLLEQLYGDMSAIDAEKGTTTGRRRRLGYLDIPQIRRAQMVNGVHETALSKLDWVPRFGETTKICIAYIREGRQLDIAPDSADQLEECTPVYEELPAWSGDTSVVRKFGDLPEAAQNYVRFIEEQSGVKISMIGVGPSREQVIVR